MKNFIVLAAVLPLMLLFVAQFALDQRNHAVTAFVEEEVRAACEEARAEGCFTASIRDGLRERLASRLGIAPSAVTITADSGVVYRLNYFDASGERGLIRYSVSVPIGRITAAAGFFGGSGSNVRILTIAGTMASERLP